MFSFLFYFNSIITIPEVQKSSNIILNNNIVIFSGKFTKFLSSSLWINTLLSSDIEHYKGKDLHSWHYNRFDTITDFDPFFLEAYKYGGLFLSVIIDDIPGGSSLYNKALKYFPYNFDLNLFGALHFLIEENNKTKAFAMLDTIKDSPNFDKRNLALYFSLKSNIGNKDMVYEEVLNQKIPESIKLFILKKLK